MSDDDLKVIQSMKRWGGGFVKALAEAALVADSDNLLKIKATWTGYWDKYRRLAELMKDEP